MLEILTSAPEDRRLASICAHPDLAGRIAREGRLSAPSANEQAAAGLDRLTPQEIARFDELNAVYRARFGFPFVICAREQTTASILMALEQRIENDRALEIAIALREIAAIARVRLKDAVT